MEKSKVYFTDFRTTIGVGLPEKLKRLCRKAGLQTMDLDNKFVAIKIHFGELGNIAYLRPNYAKAVADLVKEADGKPFLTDCNTLYPGSRKNALDHLSCAQENGFNETTTGCHIIIGDGLRGTDDITVPIEGGEYCKEAYIGRAIMDADAFISLNHFKGHECTGFGGAIKNIGMGSGSRAGKCEQHSNGKANISEENCRGCKRCLNECANSGLQYDEKKKKMTVNKDNCVGCGRCLGSCNFDAIYFENDAALKDLSERMAEYTKAVVDGRPNFHISLIVDVSPNCDCHPENDKPIIPDVGMFCSFDPLALDRACIDMCMKQEPYEDTLLTEEMKKHDGKDYGDIFTNLSPDVDWKSCLAHAEKIGLGSNDYELIKA